MAVWETGFIAVIFAVTALAYLYKAVQRTTGDMRNALKYLFISSVVYILYSSLVNVTGFFNVPLAHWVWQIPAYMILVAAAVWIVSAQYIELLLDYMQRGGGDQ